MAMTFRRVLKIVAAVPLFAFAALVALLAILWVDHFRQTTLPKPTGSFAVGRTQYVWTDSAHTNSLAAPGVERKLIAWIWYPAAPASNQMSDDYLPAPWRIALARQTGFVLTQFLNRDPSRVRTHSVHDAELSPRRSSYPVALMRGGHSALTANYTTLAEGLASQGYVVVGIDAPYRTFVVVLPDGRMIARLPENNAELGNKAQRVQVGVKLVQAWSADMSFAVDQMERLNAADPSGRFRGKLNLQRIGAYGHSLGGAEALQFCHDDPRCKAGVDVDGAPLGSVVAEGVTQPFLFLVSDHSDEPAAETSPIEAELHSIFNRLPRDRRLQVTIRRATHFGFQDDVRSPIVMSVLRMRGQRLNGKRQLAIATHYITAFFDVYLRGEPASRLDLQHEFPEGELLR